MKTYRKIPYQKTRKRTLTYMTASHTSPGLATDIVKRVVAVLQKALELPKPPEGFEDCFDPGWARDVECLYAITRAECEFCHIATTSISQSEKEKIVHKRLAKLNRKLNLSTGVSNPSSASDPLAVGAPTA